ncbi:MAG: RNA polymerase sigma-70 factor [Tannerellaceae bacterium]|nr:RNA polymerase sigma-70 factor [Tannerellaceae bacterium]
MEESNETLILRINKGDTKAFEELYAAKYVYLCAIATRYIYNKETAKEIVNDIFLGVWNNHKTLVSPLNSYLVRAVQNRCLNHLRKQQLEQIPLSEVTEKMVALREEWMLQDTHPLHKLENQEFQKRIAEAIDTLPHKCRDIFIQHIYFNKPYEEIAKEMNLASSTVRGQVRIGLAKLKPLLGDLYLSFIMLYHFY